MQRDRDDQKIACHDISDAPSERNREISVSHTRENQR